jgi:putative transcriptional regulator
MSQRIQIRQGLLKRLRDISGITSEEAQARMLGVGRSTIYRIDNGEQPSAAFMAAVCTTYQLGLGEAFEIIDETRATKSAKAA